MESLREAWEKSLPSKTLQEMKAWCEDNCDGYPSDELVPEYYRQQRWQYRVYEATDAIPDEVLLALGSLFEMGREQANVSRLMMLEEAVMSFCQFARGAAKPSLDNFAYLPPEDWHQAGHVADGRKRARDRGKSLGGRKTRVGWIKYNLIALWRGLWQGKITWQEFGEICWRKIALKFPKSTVYKALKDLCE